MDISWLGQSSFRINDEIIDILVNPEDNIDKSLLSDNTLIVNTDNSGYEAYKKARAEARRKDRSLKELQDEVAELKQLVKSLVQKEDK